MFVFGALGEPVANCGVLGFLEALSSYNFIYSRFPSTAGSGPFDDVPVIDAMLALPAQARQVGHADPRMTAERG
jgi:hypothetical protein